MRSVFVLIASSLLVISGLARAQTMPEVVEKGLALTQKEGHFAPAVKFWSGPDVLDLDSDNKIYLREIRRAHKYAERFGKIKEVQVLAVDQPIPENVIIYSVLKYEKGAVYLLTVCYDDGNDWKLTRYQFCDHPAHILPDNLYDEPPSTEN